MGGSGVERTVRPRLHLFAEASSMTGFGAMEIAPAMAEPLGWMNQSARESVKLPFVLLEVGRRKAAEYDFSDGIVLREERPCG